MHRTASVEDQGDLDDAKIGYFVTVGVGFPHTRATVENSSLMRGDTQKAAVKNLRCDRCHGRRSTSYHCRHREAPVQSPAHGICSRRRTGCAGARKALQQGPWLQSTVDLPAGGRVKEPGISPSNTQLQPKSPAPVYELSGMPIS